MKRVLTVPSVAVSLLPEASSRLAPVSAIAYSMAQKIAYERHSRTTEESISDFMDTHGMNPHSHSIKDFVEYIEEEISRDTTYDSEVEMAARAVIAAIYFHLEVTSESRLEITGWLDGEEVFIQGKSFHITEKVCPECEVNPLAYGPTWSGLQCIDTHNCGHLECF